MVPFPEGELSLMIMNPVGEESCALKQGKWRRSPAPEQVSSCLFFAKSQKVWAAVVFTLPEKILQAR
jgi:hypothetical protein